MIVLLLLFALSSARAAVDYSGYKVFRITPTTEAQLDWLHQLRQQGQYDFWKEPSFLNRPADVMVQPSDAQILMMSLSDQKINYHVTIDDVQKLIDAEKVRKTPRVESNFTDYMDYTQIVNWLHYAVSSCGSRCELINIGQSYEGRDMWLVKISTGGVKPRVWVDAGIHAREWIAYHTGLYFIDRFVFDYGVDPEVEQLLDMYDFYILPAVNPDGYVYSWTDDRMWRKTRNPHDEDNNNPCVGADANRNFDFMWMYVGASDNPCDNTFAGPYAHSEPETANQRDYMFGREWVFFMTLHSYGQLWLLPYGYTPDDPPTYDELFRVATIGVDALTAVYGTVYEIGSAADILYPSSGTSRDWAYGHSETQIPYVYTLELRDESSFILPPDQIIPTGRETWAGFKAAVFAINPSSAKSKA